MKRQPSYVKRLKKLSVKSGDIVVITLKGFPRPGQVENVRLECEAMPFMKNVNIIVTTDQVEIKKSKEHAGKHQVFLDNLEFLEYIAKHREK